MTGGGRPASRPPRSARKQMSLLNRLLLLVFGAGLIPIVPAAFFLFYYQAQARQSITAFQQTVSQTAALLTERETQDLARRLERMWPAGSKFVTQENLGRALAANPEFLYLAFTGPDGKAALSGGSPELRRYFGALDIGGSRLLRTAARTGAASMGEFELVYDRPVARLVYPLGGGYYAFAVVNLRDLAARLASQRLGSTGGLVLADGEGAALAFTPELRRFGRAEITAMLGLPQVFEFASGGAVYTGAHSRVRGQDLYVLALEDRDEAFGGISRIIWVMAFLLLAVATMFYFAALLFSHRISAPVEGLLAGAARVSAGDFSRPVPQSREFSELARLAAAFNAMMKEVERYHGIQVEKVFEEKRKLELLVGLLRDAIILCDLRGVLLYANAPARALLRADEPGATEESVRKAAADLVFLRSASRDGVITLDTAEGRRHFLINVQTIAPKTQAPAVFMVLRDITLERDLQKVKEEFFHSVAHDLRAPLLTMQGYIKLLGREFPEGAKQAGYVARVKESSDRLFRLLENILDISRMEAGHLKPSLTDIDAADFLKTAAESFRAICEEKSVALELKLPEEKLLFRGDAGLLRRVLENLLSNAWKFTPKGGKITASLSSESGRPLFSVRDTGPGIPPDQTEAVFEKYRRLKNSEGEAGFGLGLAIARKIVELHGGRVWAEPGPGGKFYFSVSRG